MGEELSDGDFTGCLERARILKLVAISKNFGDFRDAKGLRYLVRRWSPFLQHFSFLWGNSPSP